MDNGASSYRRFLDGDKNAFAELIEMYAHNLIFFINGLVNNLSIAEDLAEDTFCDLIFYKNRFKGKSSLKTYFFSIARNKAFDYIKNNSKVSVMADEELNNQLADTKELENKILANERKICVNKALAGIHSDYRAVLHLLFFEDITYEQAAIILNKSKKQMKDLVYRAKQALKVAMEKEGFVYEEL
jgi:RNA polymerase sigma-70 factor (ECF subfamily)